jgi:membrane-associated phospholipid phosphatase
MSLVNVKLRKSYALRAAALAIAAASFAGSAGAQTVVDSSTPITISGADANVLNLLSPFLSLNSTAIGQATLAANLSQSISINNGATLQQQELAISDKNLPGGASNNIANLCKGCFGVAANLAGGLPPQGMPAGASPSIIPQQPVGGFGSLLGPIYQTGVNPANIQLPNTVLLLTTSLNFTSTDLGVAKNYFANGGAGNLVISGTPTRFVAVAPSGFTLPTFSGLPNKTNSVYDTAHAPTGQYTAIGRDLFGSSRPDQVSNKINNFDPTALNGLNTNPAFTSGHANYAYNDSILLGMLVPELYQSMLSRAAEYSNSRIVLGVHYPLDIIGSRAYTTYDLAQYLSNPVTSASFSQGSKVEVTGVFLPGQTYKILTTTGGAGSLLARAGC